MTTETLAELDLDTIRERWLAYADHQADAAVRGWGCCSAHGPADAMPALLVLTERLQDQLAKVRQVCDEYDALCAPSVAVIPAPAIRAALAGQEMRG